MHFHAAGAGPCSQREALAWPVTGLPGSTAMGSSQAAATSRSRIAKTSPKPSSVSESATVSWQSNGT
eukprot:6935185-Heterocapsa_arctica.AAC.1